LPLDLLLALLNSQILEWLFRLTSTNSKVNEYQFNNLPVPVLRDSPTPTHWKRLCEDENWDALRERLCASCALPGTMPSDIADAIIAMSRAIQSIEANRVLKNRSERAHLAPESQAIQDVIDAVLFRCYGLSDDDAAHVERRLKEML
jgi:hypothetical protein